MKSKLILFSLLVFGAYNQNVLSQTYVYDGQGNIIGGTHIKTKPGKPLTLTDTASPIYYELDSAHINISAYNSARKLLWKTDPWLDNKIREYRTRRPIIVSFKFATNEYDIKGKAGSLKGEKVISIVYNNTQFGFLVPLTGEFYMLGQD